MRNYLLLRGTNPALRRASSLAAEDPLLVVLGGVVALGAVVGRPVVVPVAGDDGVIVVGVPGLTAPVPVGAVVASGVSVVGVPGVPLAPGVVATPVVLGSAPAAVGVVATVIVVVTGVTGLAVVDEPPLSASAAITAIAMSGAFQFVGAASRVRAAAPQFRHHSCTGSRAAPHSGQAASTGGPALGAGTEAETLCGGSITAPGDLGSVKVFVVAELAGRSRSAVPRREPDQRARSYSRRG